jgi:hypothetical protein
LKEVGKSIMLNRRNGLSADFLTGRIVSNEDLSKTPEEGLAILKELER